MKKKFIFGLVALMTLGLAGCNGDSNDSPSSSSTPPSSVPTSTGPSEPHPLEGQSISIHYYRFDNDYSGWALWLWEMGGTDGKEYQFTSTDDYGAYAQISLTNWSANVLTKNLGIIVKSKGSWAQKDVESDRTIYFSQLNKDASDTYHVYLKTNDPTIYTDASEVERNDIISPKFVSENKITFQTSGPIKNYKIYENEDVIADVSVDTDTQTFTYEFTEDHPASLTNTYKVEVTFSADDTKITKTVEINQLFKTETFDREFTYEGDDLGATYSEDKTTFKVWSPVSSEIKVRIYNNGTPTSVSTEKGDDTYEEREMTKGDKGVFSIDVSGDLAGKYYTYVVTNSKYKDKEVVDPYAKSAGVNGLRGMIVDFKDTNPVGWEEVEPHQYDRKQLAVYETHISDLTSSTTWSSREEDAQYAKLFKGAYIEGTTYTKDDVTVKTGFDHIKELGVNAVQLVPVFDQYNDETNMKFNWGYNPLNYNVLEGGYSTDPYDGYVRIREFKELVMANNKAGINIIMDVVYNHVNAVGGSNFDVLMPGYYYRYTSNNALSNGSGCGNETASEMPMFRKFMKDSTEFLAKEYKLGGFRFDLMGLHDLTTMDQLVANLKEFNPAICVYGEPWTGGTSTLPDAQSAKQINGGKYQGYGQFNDQMRDALIKGGMSGKTEKGWVNTSSTTSATDMTKITSGIKGFTNSNIADPNKTVNYVTCHDNYTLVDRMEAAGITSAFNAKSGAMLANSIVFTSQGTTFMLAGEEFLRTKGGDDNSYESSYEVNELDYSLKIKNAKMFENYKKLIELKTSVDGLSLDTDDCKNIQITVNNNNQIVYDIKDTANNRLYRIVHNNGTGTLGTVDFAGFTLYLDTYLGVQETTLSATTNCRAYQTIIAYKSL